MHALQLSYDLLSAVREGADTSDGIRSLAVLDPEQLKDELIGQHERLAFWINLYNAFLQIRLADDPGSFGWKLRLFMGRHFTVAGQRISLDEMEHDLLRKGYFKLSFGYLRDPFLSGFKKDLMVFERDPRIHFALNCGAQSCPPIRFYTAADIDALLDIATRSFLETETIYDPEHREVKATPLFSWFRGDFGGKTGILHFLKSYDRIPDTRVGLRFTRYDWSFRPHNFVGDS